MRRHVRPCRCSSRASARAERAQCELPVLLSTPLVPEVPELPVVLGWAVPVLAPAPAAASLPCRCELLPLVTAGGEDAGRPCWAASDDVGAPDCADAGAAKTNADSRTNHFMTAAPDWPCNVAISITFRGGGGGLLLCSGGGLFDTGH